MATAKRKVAKKKAVSRSDNWQKLMKAKAAQVAKVQAKRDSYGSGVLDLLIPEDKGQRFFQAPVGINTNIETAIEYLNDFRIDLKTLKGKLTDKRHQEIEREYEKLNKLLSQVNQKFLKIYRGIWS